MPSVIKRKTSGVAPSAFTVYAGDDPKPGGYRAVIKQMNIGKSSGDNMMLMPVIELKAAAGSEKSKFDGYPVFPVVVLTDNESNMQREQALYLALGAKADADIVPEGSPEKFKAGDKQKCKVKTIGGINPVGKIVNVKLRMSAGTDEYPARLECDLIFAARSEAGQDDTTSIDDDDIEDGDEEVELYEEDDLLKLGLPALRKILVDEFGEPADDAKAIKSKAKLVEAILAAQEEDEEDEDDESDAEEADDEDDEVEEDAEEEDEEDDEDDAEAEFRAEFADLDRAGLKAVIKKRAPDTKFKTSQTDEDLLELAVELALQDPPF